MGQAAAAVTRVAAVGHSWPNSLDQFLPICGARSARLISAISPLDRLFGGANVCPFGQNLPSTKTRPGPSVGITATTERKAWSCRTGLKSRRTISAHSGCGSRPTASSRRRRAWSCPPRTCTTRRPTAARFSTARPVSGASMPATAGRRSSRRSRSQAAELDYAPTFQFGHPLVFELANRLVDIAPEGLEHVMYTNSGSESVDTALKMAIAYHRAKGDGSRSRLIGRERGYHGVNFGGISVGGIVPNRKMFGTLLTGVDHLPHTHLPAKNAFTRGEPEHGARTCRRAGAHRRPARRLDHRRGHRRAGGRLDRRADTAQGLSEETARDLHQARHPFDLRRSHHRLRPPGHAVRRGLFRRHARHHDHRQGPDQRRHPDGRGVRHQGNPRRLHERAGTHHRVLPRLHLFGQSDRIRGCARHARHLQGRGPAHARRRARPLLGRGGAFAQGRAERHRHPQHRPRRRDRARPDRRRAGQARLQLLRQELSSMAR